MLLIFVNFEINFSKFKMLIFFFFFDTYYKTLDVTNNLTINAILV